MRAADCPPDILREIFEESVTCSNGLPSLKNAPLNVAHTCKLWRDVVLSNPRLWSRFCIEENEASHFDPTCPAYSKKLGCALQLWLGRSGNASLRCRIDHPISYGNLAMLLDHQDRWEEMTLVFLSNHQLRPALHELGQLKLLQIRYISDSGVSDSLEAMKPLLCQPPFPEVPCPLFILPSPFAPIAPHLTTLAIRGLGGYKAPRLVSLPLLRHAPNLESLHLSLSVDEWSVPRDTDFDHGGIVALHKLRSFRFESSNGYPTNVISHLRLPNIVSLYVAFGTAPNLLTTEA